MFSWSYSSAMLLMKHDHEFSNLITICNIINVTFPWFEYTFDIYVNYTIQPARFCARRPTKFPQPRHQFFSGVQPKMLIPHSTTGAEGHSIHSVLEQGHEIIWNNNKWHSDVKDSHIKRPLCTGFYNICWRNTQFVLPLIVSHVNVNNHGVMQLSPRIKLISERLIPIRGHQR